MDLLGLMVCVVAAVEISFGRGWVQLGERSAGTTASCLSWHQLLHWRRVDVARRSQSLPYVRWLHTYTLISDRMSIKLKLKHTIQYNTTLLI